MRWDELVARVINASDIPNKSVQLASYIMYFSKNGPREPLHGWKNSSEVEFLRVYVHCGAGNSNIVFWKYSKVSQEFLIKFANN
jgi:hypothetical protein